MVINNAYIKGVGTLPAKNNSPLLVDTNTVKPSQINGYTVSMQFVYTDYRAIRQVTDTFQEQKFQEYDETAYGSSCSRALDTARQAVLINQ